MEQITARDFGLSKAAASIGVMVTATKVENRVADRHREAKRLEKLSRHSPIKATGTNIPTMVAVVAITAKPISLAASEKPEKGLSPSANVGQYSRSCKWRHPPVPHCQRQRQQGHAIEGVAQRIHQREGGNGWTGAAQPP